MRILTTTGGAPHSDSAIRLAAYLAETTGASIVLLTIIKTESTRVQAEAILTRATALLASTIEVQRKVRLGQPAGQIVREAREGNYDLLILGERVHHGLTRHILAPTAERVLEQMPCPVLIARGQARPLKRLLLCESGRDPSLLNRFMSQLKPLLVAADALTLLHVMSQMAAGPGVPGWELRADAEELMEEHTPEGRLLEGDLKRLKQLGMHLEARVRHGLVVQEILEEARTGDYDLVVIGAHQRKGWERFLLDDLAQAIVDHADRPILVV